MPYLGTIGKRRDFTLYLRRMFRKETDWGARYFYVCDSEGGGTVVYSGSVYLGEERTTVTLSAVVKDHRKHRERYPETVIWHPKL